MPLETVVTLKKAVSQPEEISPLLLQLSPWNRVKMLCGGIQQMAQRLRALSTLPDGPGFNSQHPHGSSELSVTPVPELLTPSHKQICRQNTNAPKINVSKRRRSYRSMLWAKSNP